LGFYEVGVRTMQMASKHYKRTNPDVMNVPQAILRVTSYTIELSLDAQDFHQRI
jgi:hypothetical protein